MATLVVHLVDLGSQHVIEMRRVGCHLLLVPLLRSQLHGPPSVHLLDQVTALGVIHTVLLPAAHHFSLQLSGFLRSFNATLTLKVAPDELGHDDSLRWVTHFDC